METSELDVVEVTKARLRAEFPGWSIIYTDRGRWWASRDPLADDIPPDAVWDLEADTSEELRTRLQAVTAP